jgi:heptosyltransferase-2
MGYARDGRGWLLTNAVPPPKAGQIPRFEAYYYLELLRRLGWIDELPPDVSIRLAGADEAAEAGRRLLGSEGLSGPVVGVSPGAAYGTAKRWLPERFAEAAATVAGQISGSVALFGSMSERALCGEIAGVLAAQGVPAHNFAGETSLASFIDGAAACRVFLTNDSGAMHIASALGVPTVAVFGATDHTATGPTGSHSRVVREPVDCAPCLLRECPIDHRCMTRVPASRVADAALELLK